MEYKYPAKIRDEQFRLRQMVGSIEVLRDNGNWVSIISLMRSYLYILVQMGVKMTLGLSENERDVFYSNYIDEPLFDFSKGFGIARDDEMKGKKIDVCEVDGETKIYFNIDLIVKKFLEEVKPKIKSE